MKGISDAFGLVDVLIIITNNFQRCVTVWNSCVYADYTTLKVVIYNKLITIN